MLKDSESEVFYMSYNLKGDKKIKAVILYILLIFCVGCSTQGQKADEYYENLAVKKVDLKNDPIIEFINIFTTYIGRDIPDDKFLRIKKLSEPELFESLIVNMFTNTSQEYDLQDADETNGPPLVDYGEPSMEVSEIFYVYRDNAYIVKALSKYGGINFFIIKVNGDGKVYEIIF